MQEDWEHVESAILVGIAPAATAHIPIPGSRDLTVGLRTLDQQWTTPSLAHDFRTTLHELGLGRKPEKVKGSTSTLFVQSADGKRVLRLDWGPTLEGDITYHWNRSKGKYAFPLDLAGNADHARASPFFQRVAPILRTYRHLGRPLFILGAAVDVYDVYTASNRPLAVARVAGGWAGAFLGCRVGGQAGAWIGGAAGGSASFGVGIAPGAAVGAIGGCLAGGVGGYFAGSAAGEQFYQWSEDTIFNLLEGGKIFDFADPQ